MRWLPTFTITDTLMSDDRGPDAEGWLINLEWLGCILEISGLRRRSAAWFARKYGGQD
jgi:hypothetical protein